MEDNMTLITNIVIFTFIITLFIIIIMILVKLKELKNIKKSKEKSKLIDEILTAKFDDPEKEHKTLTPKESVTIINPDDAAFFIKKLIMDDLLIKQKINEDTIILTNRQKLAIFLYSIRNEVNPELFKYLKEDELEIIIKEIKQLENPDLEQQNEIIQEFHDLMVKFIEEKKH